MKNAENQKSAENPKWVNAMTDTGRTAAVREIMNDVMIHISDHALVHHKITIMRNIETVNKEFRELAGEVAMLLTYDATRNLPLETMKITTGVGVEMEAQTLRNSEILLVEILRAGEVMVEGMLRLMPTAKVGHIGISRDPVTKLPHRHYFSVPTDASRCEVFVADPMLATGGSAIDAITHLKAAGCERMQFICVLAVPEGVVALRKAHPDVEIYIGELDERLDENAFIIPGLGDAGDRCFGKR